MLVQMGPNADIKKWEEEQMGIATVRFGARDAKERNKVGTALHSIAWGHYYS